MHAGSLATLEEVVQFCNRGGVPNENVEPSIRPLNLSDREAQSLVAFLNSLPGSNVRNLVEDNLSAHWWGLCADHNRGKAVSACRSAPHGLAGAAASQQRLNLPPEIAPGFVPQGCQEPVRPTGAGPPVERRESCKRI